MLVRMSDAPSNVRGPGITDSTGPLRAGLVDIHVHFMPENVLAKVWAYFDRAEQSYGRRWPIEYRLPEVDRLRVLRSQGVAAFAPLVYAHRPGMARWLTEWVGEFADRTPGAVRTATMFPEPDVTDYLTKALENGARCVKVHVQVGGFGSTGRATRPRLGPAGRRGHGSGGALRRRTAARQVHRPGRLRRGPRQAPPTDRGDRACRVARLSRGDRPAPPVPERPPGHHDGRHPLHRGVRAVARGLGRPSRGGGGSGRLREAIPNIPYPYVEQLRAIEGWAAADDRLGRPFLQAVLHDTPGPRLLGLDRP